MEKKGHRLYVSRIEPFVRRIWSSVVEACGVKSRYQNLGKYARNHQDQKSIYISASIEQINIPEPILLWGWVDYVMKHFEKFSCRILMKHTHHVVSYVGCGLSFV